jgi:hypothetical protein
VCAQLAKVEAVAAAAGTSKREEELQKM